MHSSVSDVLLPLALSSKFQFSTSYPGGRDKGFSGLKEDFTVISHAIWEWNYLYYIVNSLEGSLQKKEEKVRAELTVVTMKII